MTTTHTAYNAGAVRQAVQTLQCAIVDPHLAPQVVSLAHQTIQQSQPAAPLVVSQWIDTYLQELMHAGGGSDVVAAVQRLAEHFKLPPPGPPLAVWEQGRLFT